MIASLACSGAGAGEFIPIAQRLSALLTSLQPDRLQQEGRVAWFAGAPIAIHDCDGYPYNSQRPDAVKRLAEDLRAGLEQGIQCLNGQGPAGRLHSYHEYQANRLLGILESPDTKTFRCVADRMFANAVASSKPLTGDADPLYAVLRETPHPSVTLDTYRIGGLLSTRHSRETYRDFFKLDETQIREHLTGSPLRLGGNHRYRNLSALLFHEMVHWLGHEHSALYPDLAHLYETCCFGGSDYIADPQENRVFQARACAALKDDDIWSNAYPKYRKMRQWQLKDYHRLKRDMRAAY